MIKVAGHWEYGWLEPKQEVMIWNLLLRDFGITDWYMWPISGVKNIEEQVYLHEKETFREILEENENIMHVYFEPYNQIQQPIRGIDLKNFEHPKDVLYIFGSIGFNPVPGNKREKDIHITVETIKNAGVPWPHQILAMALYDRLLKGWEGK